MPRIARVVAPGVPHHVTQRGNRRQRTFFCEDDYRAYINLIDEWCHRSDVEIWAYCLMPNHVHFIAVPAAEDGLRCAFGEAHRRYTLMVNQRKGWKGHLWQGRFASFPMDDAHLQTATIYIEMNPVKAGIVERPEDYLWSSAAFHIQGKQDILVKSLKLPANLGDWSQLLEREADDSQEESFRKHEHTGRPLGSEEFLNHLEKVTGRELHKKKPGPKPKEIVELSKVSP